ncbi:uncharacterized protein LOC120646232 [Panicum virgatum]|uniref:uncharacterized protein LOC120646232 n=1 Tax=Panicum virgatum TaxID=38727 RepID=UPI0019D62346|nr:uncharacterized protein LOC120646232 [Panicum virgatum]
MMKLAVRQQRYRLKKTFFDPFPLHLVMKTSPINSMSDKQWIDLVESWKAPEKMDICQTNKDNRDNVMLHQTTGSQSYMVFVENIGDKYSGHEPDAFDLFKDCHYNKKTKGYTPAVQAAIAQMENKLSTTTESEAPKVVNQVVADVLAERTRKNQFLCNVGIEIAQPTSSEQNGAVPDLQAENAKLRSIINTQHRQIDDLTMKVHETEEGRIGTKKRQVRSKLSWKRNLN